MRCGDGHNGEANSVRKKDSSAIIAADVTRFGHEINKDGDLGTHRPSRAFHIRRLAEGASFLVLLHSTIKRFVDGLRSIYLPEPRVVAVTLRTPQIASFGWSR